MRRCSSTWPPTIGGSASEVTQIKQRCGSVVIFSGSGPNCSSQCGSGSSCFFIVDTDPVPALKNV